MPPRQRLPRFGQIATLAAVVGVCVASSVASGARGSADATWHAGVVLSGSATTTFGAPTGSEGVHLLALPHLGDIRLACRGGTPNEIAFLFRNTTSASVWLIGGLDPVQVAAGQTASMGGGRVPGLVRLAATGTLTTVTLTNRDEGTRCVGSAQAMLNSTSGDYGPNRPDDGAVVAGTGVGRVVGPPAPFARVRAASVRNTTRVLALPRLGEIRLGCWATLDSSGNTVFTEIVFYVRNTQKSRLQIESDSRSSPQFNVRPRAIAPVTGRSVIRGYKHGVFPALLRVTGPAATATVVASGGRGGNSRCTGAVQATLNPTRGHAATSARQRLRSGTVLAGSAATPFAVAEGNPVPVMSLPGLGEVELSCIAAPPGPSVGPRIAFALRNTASHPISLISDSQAQIVTARPGARVPLPGVVVLPAVGHFAVGPEISEVWDARRIATLTLTGNLASNGELVNNVGRVMNSGTINGCLGIAQAVINR